METIITPISELTDQEMELMNLWMKKEFGEKYVRKFKEYYNPKDECFFIKEGNEIVAFGIMNKVTATHLGKEQEFFGMGDIVTIRRSQGYGRVIMEAMINHLKEQGNPGLGFCARNNLPFYEKIGLGTKENLMERFRYKDPQTGILAPIEKGDAIFHDQNNFIKEILESSDPIYLDTKLW